LKLEYYILAVVEIIPFGSLFMLIFKLFLFLPENAISHEIYKRIQKHLEKVKLEEYNSHFGIALSFICTNTVAILMKLICKIAAYIDSKHIEEVEKHILDIIKTLEYKKAAINMRYSAVVSEVNKDLNSSEFNISVEEEGPAEKVAKKVEKTEIGSHMSKILAELDNEDVEEESMKMKAEQMIIKPDKLKGQKAKYEDVEVQYFNQTSKITLTNKHKVVEGKTLKEVRWITKNMLNIELIFQEGGTKILKLKDASEVVRWVEPVCVNLQKIKEQVAKEQAAK